MIREKVILPLAMGTLAIVTIVGGTLILFGLVWGLLYLLFMLPLWATLAPFLAAFAYFIGWMLMQDA